MEARHKNEVQGRIAEMGSRRGLTMETREEAMGEERKESGTIPAARKRMALEKTLRTAFPHTVPILASFLFWGFAYGVYMNSSGFSVWYTLAMSSLIYGGSLEMLAVQLLPPLSHHWRPCSFRY